MRGHRKSSFTPEEDAIILSYMRKAEADPDASKKAMYYIIADEINKDPEKIKNRATGLRKANAKNTEPLNEKDKYLARLREIKKDQQQNETRANHYKDKFKALKVEHEALKKKYNALKKEDDEILRALREVFAENQPDEDEIE